MYDGHTLSYLMAFLTITCIVLFMDVYISYTFCTHLMFKSKQKELYVSSVTHPFSEYMWVNLPSEGHSGGSSNSGMKTQLRFLSRLSAVLNIRSIDCAPHTGSVKC